MPSFRLFCITGALSQAATEVYYHIPFVFPIPSLYKEYSLQFEFSLKAQPKAKNNQGKIIPSIASSNLQIFKMVCVVLL